MKTRYTPLAVFVLFAAVLLTILHVSTPDSEPAFIYSEVLDLENTRNNDVPDARQEARIKRKLAIESGSYAPTDEPDLDAERDFEMTRDPGTGTVPLERLWQATELATAQRNTALQRVGKSSARAAVTDIWTERGPTNVGGRVRGLMWDPNTANKFWAGGVSGGLWTTADITSAAAIWTKVDDFWDNLAINSLVYDPTRPDTMYAGTGEGWLNFDAVRGAGIWRSIDGGATWAQLGSTTGTAFQYVMDLLVHPSTGDLYATLRGNGVYRSQDGGLSWTTVYNPAACCTDLEVGADGSIYVASGLLSLGVGTVHKSPAGPTVGDTGTWAELTGATSVMTGVNRIELATAPSDANRLYAAAQDTLQTIDSLYVSVDAGVTWSAITLPVNAETCTIPASDFTRGQAWYDLIMQVDPNDEDNVLVGGIDLFRSTDGGGAWTQLSAWIINVGCGTGGMQYVHADQHAIEFRPGSSTEAVFGHDGGIDYIADVTAATPTFVNRNNQFNVTQFYSAALHPTAGSNIMLGGTQDNGTHRYTAAGLGATTEVSGGDGGFSFIDQDTPTQAIASTTRNNWRRSTNSGASFVNLFGENSGRFINPADYDDVFDVLYSARAGNQFLRLLDYFGSPSATAWTASLIGGGTPSAFKVSPHDAGTSTLFIGTPGFSNTRATLVRIDSAHTSSVTQFDEDPNNAFPIGGYLSSIDVGVDDDQLLVTFSNYGVTSIFETTDGGVTWNDKEGNLPDIPVRWALYNPVARQEVIIATEAGVWETDDITVASPTWTPAATVPTVRVDMLQHRPADGAVMASTHGRGVYTSFFLTPLPVELAAFEAVTSEGDIILSWETASETNNAGFELERRLGETDPSAVATWERVAFVEGAGTVADGQSYRHVVGAADPGVHVFRLQQIGRDGARQVVGGEVEISVDLPGTHRLAASFPNPFSTRATFSLAVSKTQDISIEVFDVAGRRVSVLHDGELEANRSHQFVIDGTSLASGTYFYRVSGETFTDTGEAVLVK